MDKLYEAHYNRVEAGVLTRYSAATVSAWIEKHTKIAFQPFNFKDHEYQIPILNDDSQELNCRKCSQIGMSEVSVRRSLARVNILSPYTIAYTLPTSKFATKFMKTRVDPVIQGSPEMKESINTINDNSEVKQFGNSFFYLMGASSGNAPISVPCDELVHDELDFCDQDIIGQYQSRLTHSRHQIVSRFSTPTVPKYGIDLAMINSRRYVLFTKCDHCNHFFVPDYYQHVRIPGFKGDLREINKQNKRILATIEWQQAVLVCPKCGAVPDISHENRTLVCENPSERHIAVGFQVSPFDAPKIIRASSLVKASTDYERSQDFVNFALGLAAEDTEATLTRAELLALLTDQYPGYGYQYVMGVDVGNTYHFQVDAIDYKGDAITVLTEQVPMGKAKARYAELKQQYRICSAVIDSGPHAETVMALQATDPNLYAAVYTRVRGVSTYHVLNRESDPDEGIEFVRQLNINRSRAFDGYMGYIRDNHRRIMHFPNEELRDLYIEQHTSMKRVKVYNNDSGEMEFSWQKTDGNDHFHHAGVYAWIAGRIKGLGYSYASLPILQAMSIRTEVTKVPLYGPNGHRIN